jgi:excisionase family DNA binding protein
MRNMELEKLGYTPQQAADTLGISLSTVRRDVRLDRIKVTRYGRRILISRAEILRIARDGLFIGSEPDKQNKEREEVGATA